jgi:hypothetical protein
MASPILALTHPSSKTPSRQQVSLPLWAAELQLVLQHPGCPLEIWLVLARTLAELSKFGWYMY